MKKVLWSVGIIFFAAAQALVFMGLAKYAAVVLVSGVLLVGGIILSRQKLGFMSDNMPVILAVTALILAATATFIVKALPVMALIMYICSGALLFFAKPSGEGLWSAGELKTEKNVFEKWEPWFFLVLMIVTILIRFVGLHDVPPGIGGHEVVQLGEAGRMSNIHSAYEWHLGASAEWPSITLYQGILFSNIFGWDIGNFRLEGAIWGSAMVAIFYFLIRTLFSPTAAAFAAVLIASSAGQITISRGLGPFHIMYASILLATWLFITALKNKRWWLFALSGLMLGFTLHGYIAGRILPAIFGLWVIYLWLFRRQHGLKIRHFVFITAGFLISAGPIFYGAFKQPELYWGYLNSVNPNNRTGVMGYINTILGNLPHYLQAFHIKGDSSAPYQVPCNSMLEFVAQMLFPMGFFMAVFMLFTPVGFYVLAFFAMALLPAMLGAGGTGHPGFTRMFGVFFPIYILVAFAFERIRKSFGGFRSKTAKVVFAVAAVFLAGFGAYNGIHEYFFHTVNNREFRVMTKYGYYLADREIRRSKNEHIIVSRYFENGYDSFGKGRVYTIAATPEDFLILDPSKDNLLLIEPYMENIVPRLQEFFPEAKVRVYKETADEIGKYCIYNIQEQSNPDTHLIAVRIPAASVKKFQALTNLNDGSRVLLDDAGFAKANAGKKIRIKGSFILRESEVKAVLELKWPGWKIQSENILSTGKAVFETFGVNYFVLEGTVPASAEGTLPLSLAYEAGNGAADRLFSVNENYGMKIRFYSERKAPYRTPVLVKNLMFPDYRFVDGYCAGLGIPFMVVFESRLKAIENTQGKISTVQPSYTRIYLNGKLIQNSILGETALISTGENIPAGAKTRLTIDFDVAGGSARTFILNLPKGIDTVLP